MPTQARQISLSREQRRELNRIVRRSTAPAGLSRRARAILLMSEGHPNTEVSKQTGLGPVQVSRIRTSFAEKGLPGIEDRPRSGRPKTVLAKTIANVIAVTVGDPPKGVSHWSSRAVAQVCDVSQSTVVRIWREANLKPHRLETFKFTTDPRAKEKIIDVVGLYLNPPENAVVLCVDEKTQIQALDRTQPILPMREGLPARMTHDYRRHGVTSLFAALEVATGEVTGICRPKHATVDFIAFLDHLAHLYDGEEIHVVLDNASTHSTPAVRAWQDEHPNVHFHFTPTGASWLNMIEAWFSILTRRSVRRATVKNVKQLTRRIRDYIKHWNLDPTPFTWTKTAEEIIAKAIR